MIRQDREQAGTEVQGEVVKVPFRDEDSLFTVVRVATGQGTVTVTGYLDQVQAGQRYAFSGEWHQHPRYGKQLRVRETREVLPTTVEGIRAYLASELVPGVGEALASRLVENFGSETLDVIRNDPQRLLQIPGVGAAISRKLQQALEKNPQQQQALVFLHSFGIGRRLALKIYRRFTEDTAAVVRENPYRLQSEVSGVGFSTADMIARHLGFSPHDPARLEGALRQVLDEACYQQGHSCVPRPELWRQAAVLVQNRELDMPLEEEALASALERLERQEVVVRHGEDLYLAPVYQAEQDLAARLAPLVSQQFSLEEEAAYQALTRAQETVQVSFSPQQLEVLRHVLGQALLVVTGGPGTGKSTVVSGILAALRALEPESRLLLAAPTGRAAKRLEELAGHPASTLHRLLGLRPDLQENGAFTRGVEETLPGDLLVVDEFSMVDLFLAQSLFRALPPDMRVVLVGDVDQLPSIGPGQVLRDIIESEVVPTVRLQHIFRQAESSGIVRNAHRINQGQMVDQDNSTGDFLYLRQEDPEQALQEVRLLFRRALESLPLEEVQVISPMHGGVLGVENLNRVLQEECNPGAPDKEELPVGDRVFRVGDKVMAVKNNYDKGVFNGNLGRLVRVLRAQDPEETELQEDSLLVQMDGEAVLYRRSELEELVPAYAITVHKAQGSEFRFCILPLSDQHSFMLDRNLFYTAVTRARQMVTLVGNYRALRLSVSRSDRYLRRTGLPEALRAAAGLAPRERSPG